MAHITITHEPGEHTTLTGSAKGDGILEIVRMNGRFTWNRWSRIHIAASRDKAPQMHRINTAKKALEEAGHTVTLEIDDTVRPTAEREADRAERSAARVERLAERADRTGAKADARHAASNAISDHIPFGQPILVGHHSEGRARRDVARMDNHMRAYVELGKEADRLFSLAKGSADRQAMRDNPRVTMRRVDKLQADRRTYERRVAEAGGADKAPNAAREVARLTEEITYWEGLLAELAASGAFVAWGPEHFRKGDFANVRGRWCEVTRINKKSVSVRNRYGWDSAGTVTWDGISGRRRDGEQIDTPNGEPWPVELARKVARWADLVATASRARNNTPRHGSDEERTVWHVGYAQRLVHGLRITAADAEVRAFAPPAADTETTRLLAGASVDIFDRLQAGELVPDILASITPLRPVEPAWTMPEGEPKRLPVKELRKGDIVAGLYGTGGLFGGGTDTLSRYFCGPVAQVVPHKGDEYSGERFVGYWTVVLEDGTSREFKPWNPVGVHVGAARAGEESPAPGLVTVSRGDCPSCGTGTAAPAGYDVVTCAHCSAQVSLTQAEALPAGPYPFPPVLTVTRETIRPEDLHLHHKVREIATGRTVHVKGGDARYEVTGPGVEDYRISTTGDHFLAESAVHTHPWGRPMRLDEVEALPDGAGLYHPAALDVLGLAMTYEGSWRQAAGVPNEWAARYAEQFPGVPLPAAPGTVRDASEAPPAGSFGTWADAAAAYTVQG